MVLGLFSSSKTETSSATAADLSAKGMEYEQLYNILLQGYLDQVGYDVKIEQKETYKDEKKASGIQAKIDSAQANLTAIESQLASYPSAPKYSDPKFREYQKLLGQKTSLTQQVNTQKEQLAKQPKETYSDFTTVKKEDLRVQSAIDKYGANSKEAEAARSKVAAENLFKTEAMADVTKNYLTSLKKFTSGDMSYTAEQKKAVDKLIDPVKKVLMKTTDDLLTKYKDDYSLMTAELDKIGEQITKTNYDVESALAAAQVQIEKGGENLFSVLEKANESSFERSKFEFDLLSEQIDRQVDDTNALLGLPPTSQSAIIQKAKLKDDALRSIQLNLAEQTAKGALSIQAGVEEGKNKISLARVGLAETTGAKREGLAATQADFLNSFLGKEESVYAARSDALVGLEQERSKQLYNASTGNVMNILSAGQSGLNFETAQKSQGLSQLGGAMGATSDPLSFEKNLQTYEGTRKTTATAQPSFFDSLTDVASVGLGGWSTIKDLIK